MLGKRVMVIGCCGSGKSTVSKRLSQLMTLPLIHLDREYWKPDWERPASDEWSKKVEDLSKKQEWIIDGNYYSTLSIRMKHADTVVFLDFNRFLCLYRVIKRSLSGQEKMRSDMAEGCQERLDIDFYRFVWGFNRTMRPRIYELIKNYQQLNIVILKNSRDVKNFVEEITNTYRNY